MEKSHRDDVYMFRLHGSFGQAELRMLSDITEYQYDRKVYLRAEAMYR